MAQELSKEELLDRIEETARNYERDYHGCSRCVLLSLQEHLNLGNDLTLKASTPLAAGVAMRGETCGALLGGVLAIGLATASKDMEDEAAFFGSLTAGFRYARRFVKAIGNSTCRDIQIAKLGRFFNLTDPEEYKQFKEAEAYKVCSKVVGEASRLAAELILELREGEKAIKD